MANDRVKDYVPRGYAAIRTENKVQQTDIFKSPRVIAGFFVPAYPNVGAWLAAPDGISEFSGVPRLAPTECSTPIVPRKLSPSNQSSNPDEQ
jgi:hypothetical protein